MLDDLSGEPRPIEVRIFSGGSGNNSSNDRATLAALAKQAAAKLATLDSLDDLVDGVEGEVPSLTAEVNPTAAAALELSAASIAADLEVALAGRVAARVRQGDRTYGVRVRLPDAVRFDPARIAQIPLAAHGATIALAAVAQVSQPIGPAALLRENQRPVVILSAGVRGADLDGAAEAVRKKLADLPLPPGFQLEVGGQAEGARETRDDLAAVFALGLFLVLAVLLVQLGSLRWALVVLAGAPLAIAGALVALAITHIPLNASSMTGCVLLAGLVVKNGILLLEHAAHAVKAGVPLDEALAEAAERRVRPIVMTTAATIAGLLPLALGLGAGAELQRPLAVATIGGLILSTSVTLLAMPALAYAVRRREQKANS